MRDLILVCLGVLSLLFCPSQSLGQESMRQVSYSGTINGNLSIKMSFMMHTMAGQSEVLVSGFYYYVNQTSPLTVTGSINKTKIQLKESASSSATGEITGTFDGTATSEGFSGTWKSPDGKRSYPFILKKDGNSSTWAEYYAYPPPGETAATSSTSLWLLNINGSFFTQITTGTARGCMGEIYAPTFFDSTGIGKLKPSRGNCRVWIKKLPGAISVEEFSDCLSNHGAGCSFAGKLSKL